MTRLHRILVVLLPIFVALVIILEKVRTGIFHWSYVGVAILVVILVWFHSKRGIQKLIGEYPNPQRRPIVARFSGIFVPILALILSLYMMLFQMNKATIDPKNLLILVVSPIILTICFGIMKVPDLTKVTKTRLKSVIKKIITSTILFILFVPLFGLTNVLNPNIDSTPDLLNGLSWFRGFIIWSMVCCFFVGLYLFCYALIDLIPIIKDASTRKQRRPKKKPIIELAQQVKRMKKEH
jgi:hypothetical protein